jgi:FMN phosphatase YigB (HAD superfamily)
MTYVIFDIDGTLADNTPRAHFLTREPKDWNAFYDAMARDAPIQPMVILADALGGEVDHLVLCTGRPDSHWDTTVAWLEKYIATWSGMYRRKANDHRPDTVIKLEMLDTIRDHYDGDPLFVVEDRASMVRAWRTAGLTCLQCAEGKF